MPNPSLRPAIYDAGKGRISVTLTFDDVALGHRVGIARYTKQREGKNKDAAFRKNQGPRNDIEGAIVEVAFWLLCGLEPPPEMVLSIPEWERERGPNGGRLTDCLGVEIRGTSVEHGGLFIHKDGTRDGEAKLDTPFVLGILPLISLEPLRFDNVVTFMGWFYGREVKDEHFFEHCQSPDYRVSQQELRWMSTLTGRFELPAEDPEVVRRRQEIDELFRGLT